ncbi:hypothetical protein Lesp02_03520 [Lentzea sp. NBRC 105346]|uniref:DUF3800 domain-containing protein n=1 Tax=Lentzea sp. NBRC 105346 TaxID=3032205 RepID=UPI0024A50403|nr:DUF3800 domain-containing protein [Lentzea sp. NBRC 105346]GLZ28162.1 hypothetical protein Lesp02_03520 [Lentzea sp. NBRC 105346]
MVTNVAALPVVRVYIDETGDRGFKPTSSPTFGFCAVLVPDEHDNDLRTVIQTLRNDFEISGERPVHWKEHLRPRFHERRRHAAKRLATVPGVQVIHVVIDKANVPLNAGMRGDIVKTYNYALRLLFERIAFAVRDWPGGSRRAIVKVAHVKGHDHAKSLDYVTKTCPVSPSPVSVPWNLVTSNVTIEGTTAVDGLQAADLYAGMFNAAITPDRFGNNWPEYLLAVTHQIRRGPNGKVCDYGIKILGDKKIVTDQDWWPQIQT